MIVTAIIWILGQGNIMIFFACFDCDISFAMLYGFDLLITFYGISM